MTRQRDSQRSKVYKAEYAAFGHDAHRAEFTLAECRTFIDKVQASAHWKKLVGTFADHNIYLKDGRGCRSASGGYGGVTLPVWARNKYTILHELGHVAHQRLHGWEIRQEAWHGWRFCEINIGLIQHFVGKDAANKLKASYKEHKVKYTAPRAKRVLTDEQKAAGAARLAAARAARPKNPFTVEHVHKVNFKEVYRNLPHSYDIDVIKEDGQIVHNTFYNRLGEARKYGEEKAKAVAKEFPGEIVKLRITPDSWNSPRWGYSREDAVDIKTYLYEAA